MYSTKNLEISGFQHEPLPHTFFRQDTEASHVAILLPGWNYTCHMPLLYYPARLLLESGADVLQVEYAYNTRRDFQELSRSEQMQCLFADTHAACNAVLAQRTYEQVTIIGKSIGTLAMGHVFTTDTKLAHARAVWLTPLLRNDRLRAQIKSYGQRSLFVIGTADPQYDPTYLAEVKEATNGEAIVVEGADHSLESKDNVLQSLKALEEVIRGVQTFFCLNQQPKAN